MNLRDQLLKAGVISQKQAKQAKQEERQRKKKTDARSLAQSEQEAIKGVIEERAEAKRKRDLQLNERIKEELRLHEMVCQIGHIMYDNDLRTRGRAEPYYFVAQGDPHIYSIRVTEEQAKELEFGRLGITRMPGDEGQFCLLPKTDCLKIKELDAQFLVCLHEPIS